MRNPIHVGHEKLSFQVIWRRGDGPNWSHYVEAETADDAIFAARNLMALDSAKYPDEIGNRRKWFVVEARELNLDGSGTDPFIRAAARRS